MKVVMALSGGMDSTTLLAKALEDGYEVVPVQFQYGSKHNAYEEQAYRRILLKYPTSGAEMNLRGVFANFESALLKGSDQAIPHGHYESESMKLTVVPGRNIIFMSILAGYAWSIGAKEVWLGIHAGDHAIYPDCRISFFNAMNEAIKLGTDDNVELNAPFLHLLKKDILALGLKLEVPYALTRTCYADQLVACGKCGSCQERLEAFHLNGVEDPLRYQSRELMGK